MSRSAASQSTAASRREPGSFLSLFDEFVPKDAEETIRLFRRTYIFPLFTDLVKWGHLPQIFYLIQLVIFWFQILGCFCWTTSLDVFRGKASDFVYFVRWFSDWGVLGKPLEDCVAQYVVSYIISGLQLFCLLGMFAWFRYRRSYPHWQLLLFNFLNHVLLSLTIPVHGTLCGHAFCELVVNSKKTVHMSLFFAISLIFWGMNVVLFDMVNQYTSETPILSRSWLAQWDRHLFSFVILVGLVEICIPVCDAFPSWVTYFGTIVAMLTMCYPLYLLWFFPMVRFEMNAIVSSVMISSISGSAMAFVHCFTKDRIDDFYYLLIPIVAGAISFVFFVLVFHYRKKKICEFLSSETLPLDGKKSVEDLRRQRFDAKVFSSVRDVISYIRVGVAFHCEMLIDLSFLRYILECYEYPELILFVAKAAAFFPTETTFVNKALQSVGPEERLETAERFLVFQLKRIHILRQSSVSVEASQEFQVLQKKTKEAISHVRGFWGEILNAKTDISFSSLYFIRNTSLSVDAAFLSAIDRFPNNSQIMREYTRFQIEAMGAFSSAIRTGKNALSLDEGKMLAMDHSFKSLVNVFPDYLFSGVIDSQGNIINKGVMRVNTTAQFGNEELMGEKYDHKYNDVMAMLFHHGRLRVAIQRRLESVKLKSVTCAQNVAILQMVVSVLIFLLIVILLPFVSEEIMEFVECIDSITKTTTRISQVAALAVAQATVDFGVFQGPKALEDILGLTPEASQTVFSGLFEKLIDSSDILIASLLGTLQQTIGCVGKADSFSEYYLIYKRYGARSYANVILSVRGALSYYAYIASVVGTTGSRDPHDEKLIPWYSELMSNAMDISENVLQAQTTIRDAAMDAIADSRLTIIVISIFSLIICLILFAVCRIYSLICIFQDRKYCSTLLRGVTPDMVKESYVPISLQHQNEVMRGNQVHTAHDLDVSLRCYPIGIVISIICPFALMYVSTFGFTNSFVGVNQIFTWFEQESSTFLAIVNATNAIARCGCGILSHGNTSTALIESIKSFKSTHQSMDVSIIGNDRNLDNLYFRANCPYSDNILNSTQYYDCLSIDNRLNLAKSAIIALFRKEEWGDLNTPEFTALIYLVNNFLVTDLMEVQDSVVSYATRILTNSYQISLITSVVAIAVAITTFLIEKIFLAYYQQSIEAVKQLIRVLPPLSVVSSTGLMSFITLGTNKDNLEGTMTATESLLSSSSYAIIVIDTNGVIQTVNNAVNQIFGYTPDQILGQTIQYIIPETEHVGADGPEFDFYLVMRQMLRPNSVETNMTLNVKCRADADTMIDVKLALLCIRDDSGKPQSFALFLRNTCEEMAEKKEAEQAKATTDTLVKALLPKDMWTIWDSENKNTLVKSDSVAVMVVGIDGLDEFIHTLNAEKLVKIIGDVYAKVDTVLPKFPRVRVVLSRYDYFIAVAGLFDKKTSHRRQAADSVGLAMSLFDAMDELNEEIDLALSFRIAVEVGGPIYGRILDEEHPIFELYGDLIELAMTIFRETRRRQLKVGKSVKDQLDPNQFEIVPCQEIIDPETNVAIENYAVRLAGQE